MIEVSHIEKRFGDNVVLKDVSVTLAEGTVTALVGPSGGGKSTLLRCINLLEIPTAGTIRIGDKSLQSQPGKKVGFDAIQPLRRQTGMVFQNFQLFPHQTVIQNVMEGLVTVLKWPKQKAHATRWRCWKRLAWHTRRTLGQRRFQAASSSAWPLRVRLPRTTRSTVRRANLGA